MLRKIEKKSISWVHLFNANILVSKRWPITINDLQLPRPMMIILDALWLVIHRLDARWPVIRRLDARWPVRRRLTFPTTRSLWMMTLMIVFDALRHVRRCLDARWPVIRRLGVRWPVRRRLTFPMTRSMMIILDALWHVIRRFNANCLVTTGWHVRLRGRLSRHPTSSEFVWSNTLNTKLNQKNWTKTFDQFFYTKLFFLYTKTIIRKSFHDYRFIIEPCNEQKLREYLSTQNWSN